MKVEYIESFYRAIEDVFQTMLSSDISRDEISLSKSLDLDGYLGVLLEITGDLKGYVYFTFPEETSLEMVKIMTGMDMDQIDKFTYSALAEVVNIVSGNAVTKLSEREYICDITPPKVFSSDLNSAIDGRGQAVCLPINSKAGEFQVNIYIYE